MTLLELKNVTKHYSPAVAPALADISFSVNEGEFISVIGPSGSGKTTLLRTINRMVELSGGEITFAGVSISRLRKSELRKLRSKIGMIFQHYNLVDRMSVIENVLHGRLGHKSTLAGILGSYTLAEKEQALRIIQMLGLDEYINKRCDQLSGGQKQRVGIARALVQNPKLILCDEPIASLDPSSAKIIMDYLKNISRDLGITLLVSLHQVDIALKYSDRVIGVNRGTIVFDGKPDELTRERVSEIYGFDAGDLMINLGESEGYAS
ncbi:phosphate-import ATP-binding protein PhnC [Peptococcaceae bacterium CEB3]|nr:phosphate-import ATP-binding protein PhnC [Peptococcaceae bacterium CEB3]